MVVEKSHVVSRLAMSTARAAVAVRKMKRARTRAKLAAILAMLEEDEDDSDREVVPIKRTRRVCDHPDYSQSSWAIMLRAEELNTPTSRQAVYLRRRFRIPDAVTKEVIKVVEDQSSFPRAQVHLAGTRDIPVELKVCKIAQRLLYSSLFQAIFLSVASLQGAPALLTYLSQNVPL